MAAKTTKVSPKCTAARHAWDWRNSRPESHGCTMSFWETCSHCGVKRQQETAITNPRQNAIRYLIAG